MRTPDAKAFSPAVWAAIAYQLDTLAGSHDVHACIVLVHGAWFVKEDRQGSDGKCPHCWAFGRVPERTARGIPGDIPRDPTGGVPRYPMGSHGIPRDTTWEVVEGRGTPLAFPRQFLREPPVGAHEMPWDSVELHRARAVGPSSFRPTASCRTQRLESSQTGT